MKTKLNFLSAGILLATIVAGRAQSPTADDFNPNANNTVYATAIQPDGKVLLGGSFTLVAGVTRNRIARVEPDGTLDTAFNPGADSTVMALAVLPDGKIVVAGWFTTLGGAARSRIGLLNPDGTTEGAFNPGANGFVYALAVQADGKILVGGGFTTLAGQPRNYLGRLNADGTLDAGFNPGANALVRSLAVQADGKILVGGSFSTLGDQTRYYLGRLNTDGTLDGGFNPEAGSSVYALAVQADGKIVVGGGFTALGGQTRNYLGRLDADGMLDSGFNPGPNAYVISLAVQADGKIVVGGDFATVAGQSRNRIARLNADGTLDSAFNPGADSSVYSVAVQADGKVLVGGGFTTLAGQTRSRIGRLHSTEPATQTLTYDGSSVIWARAGSGPEVWRTTFDYSTNETDWLSLGAGTRVTGGWQVSSPALPTNTTLRARGFVAGGYDNASSWFVEITNSFGSGAPSILTQPASRTNNVGTTAHFSVVASGTPPLSYQWRKDELALADGGNVAGATTFLLTLSNVFGSEAGSYSVVVTNALGGETSLVATLTVIDPLITTQPQSRTNVAGTTASFTVAATGTQPLAYQWQQLNGSWSDLADSTNSALILTNVQISQAGDYRVVVTNMYSAANSAVAHLTVLGPTLQWAASAYTVAENAGAVTLTVRRVNDTNTPATVDYTTANGTATAGLDYPATNGTLTFAAGETSQTVTVPILDDGWDESNETFTVTLSHPTGEGAVLGTPATTTVSITDNDEPHLEIARATNGVDLNWLPPMKEHIVVEADQLAGPWCPCPYPHTRTNDTFWLTVPCDAPQKFFRVKPGRQFTDDFSTLVPTWTPWFQNAGVDWIVTNGTLQVSLANQPAYGGLALCPLGATNPDAILRDFYASVDTLDWVTSTNNWSTLGLFGRGSVSPPRGYFGGIGLNYDDAPPGYVMPWIVNDEDEIHGVPFDMAAFPPPYRVQFSGVGNRMSLRVVSLTTGVVIREMPFTVSAYATGIVGLWFNGRYEGGDAYTNTVDNFVLIGTK